MNSSPVLYIEDLVKNPDESFKRLYEELNWVHADGGKVPRKEYYVNDYGFDYSYGSGGFSRNYSSCPTHSVIEEIRERLKEELDVYFDVVFLNLYEDERNHLGWHADDSPEMSHDHPIVSVSLGAKREIWYKEKESKDIEKILLGNGSAFVMLPGMQKTHYHRIPKCDRKCGSRISLTFRKYVKV